MEIPTLALQSEKRFGGGGQSPRHRSAFCIGAKMPEGSGGEQRKNGVGMVDKQRRLLPMVSGSSRLFGLPLSAQIRHAGHTQLGGERFPAVMP